MTPTKKKLQALPKFAVDPETGKYYPVPLDFQAVCGDGTKLPKSNNSSSKKIMDAALIQPVKFRKIENGVRKELFKIPAAYQRNMTETKDIKPKTSLAGVRKTLSKALPSANNSNDGTKKLSEKKRKSPTKLIDIEQTESQDARYPFKHPATPQLQFIAKDNVKMSSSQESDIEFLKFEQLYKTPKVTNESPVSSVCNLFESKMLLNADSENILKAMNQKEIIDEIRRVAKYDRELQEDTSKKIQEILTMQARHEQNIRTIMTFIDKLDDNNTKNDSDVCNQNEDEKENSFIRRSLRLQNKSPNNLSRPMAVSPVILKSGDLRKSTLTKSLVYKCQKYQIDSPRIHKALEMYNTTKNTCSALLTPKISSMRNGLSMKVQKQCLMLQFSPGRN